MERWSHMATSALVIQFHCGSHFHSLITRRGECLSIFLSAIKFSIQEMPIHALAHFSTGCDLPLIDSEFFTDTILFLVTCVANIFSQYLPCRFSLFTVSFNELKVFIFMVLSWSSFPVFSFYAFCVLFKFFSLCQGHEAILLHWLLKSLSFCFSHLNL